MIRTCRGKRNSPCSWTRISSLWLTIRKTRTSCAGSYGRGLFRSLDGGVNWNPVGLDVEYVRTVAFSDCQPGTVYVGIEPAELFRSRDLGVSWECLHIRRLPEAANWSLPYSPRSGALRTVALHPTNPRVIYGRVEQGGVIKSIDGGKAWSLDHEHVDKDVHWITMDRSRPDVLLAATGDGLFLRKDGAIVVGEAHRRIHTSCNDPSARSDDCFCRARA